MDWRKAPPLTPDPAPADIWWAPFAGPDFDWAAWRRAREAQQARLRNLGSRVDPLNRTSEGFRGEPRGRSFKRRDNG